jgi:RNA polymerase sigma factor (sigma-70 family)
MSRSAFPVRLRRAPKKPVCTRRQIGVSCVCKGVGIELDVTAAALEVGDRPTVESWFREHHRALVQLAFFHTGSQEVAEDVVADVFAKVMDRSPTVQNAGAYLRRAVVNGANSVHRRRALLRRRPPHLPAAVSLEACETFDVLSDLPVDQRTVVVLHYWEGLSIDEIAELLQRPRGTVASWQHRALVALREVIDR